MLPSPIATRPRAVSIGSRENGRQPSTARTRNHHSADRSSAGSARNESVTSIGRREKPLLPGRPIPFVAAERQKFVRAPERSNQIRTHTGKKPLRTNRL